MESTAVNPIVQSTLCLTVHFSRPGVRRRLRDDQYEVEADKALVGAAKKILDAPEYAQVASFESSVKSWLRSKALPSKLYRQATYLLPLKSVKAVDAYLAAAKQEHAALVDAFVEVYPQRKAETMERLGAVANEADYPSAAEVKAAFGFDYEYVTLSTPSTLKQISGEMFQREEERLEARLKAAESEIVGAFREQFMGMVEAMRSLLAGEAIEGKGMPQRFAHAGRRIERMQAFIDAFKAEGNVCGDEELVALMGDASKMLAGVDPRDLKKDDGWRNALASGFADIKAKLETMAVPKGRRLIEPEEE